MVLRFNRPHKKTLDLNHFVERRKAQEILENLEILARKIGTHVQVNNRPLQIELSGGLAIPLTISEEKEIADFLKLPLEQRGIYREHKAFHLSMYAPELIKLEKLFAYEFKKQNRYTLVTHPFSANLNPLHANVPWIDWKIDKYEKISAKQAIDEKVHNLRFVEINDSGEIITPHRNRLSYLDVYPYQYENNSGESVTPWHSNQFALGHRVFSPNEVRVVSWDKHEVRLPVTLYSPKEINIGSCKIRVVGLPWVRLVKETRERQDDVDRYDMNLINQYIRMKGL